MGYFDEFEQKDQCACAECRKRREEEHAQHDPGPPMSPEDMLEAIFGQGVPQPPQQQPTQQHPSHGETFQRLPQPPVSEKVHFEKQGNQVTATVAVVRATLPNGAQNVPVCALAAVGSTPEEAQKLLQLGWNGIVEAGQR